MPPYIRYHGHESSGSVPRRCANVTFACRLYCSRLADGRICPMNEKCGLKETTKRFVICLLVSCPAILLMDPLNGLHKFFPSTFVTSLMPCCGTRHRSIHDSNLQVSYFPLPSTSNGLSFILRFLGCASLPFVP